MSRSTTSILVAITFLSSGALLGTLMAPRTVEAAKDAERFAPPRIAYVNIAKVLREFQKANADGTAITKKRQEFVDKVKPLRDQVATKTRDLQQITNPAKREVIEGELTQLQRQIEDIDKQAQRELTEMTDRTIVDVYQVIKTTIAALAKERGLDVVECYPDASNEVDDKKPAVAQLKLQTPALIPYYLRKELDMTDDVVERLNKNHPAETK